MSKAIKALGLTVALPLGLLLIPLTLTLMNTSSTLNGGPGGGFDWGVEDFLAMGVLLVCVGIAAQLAVRFVNGAGARVLAVLLAVSAGFVVWAELSVGGVSLLIAHLS